jgi:hypothetical protein
MSSSARPLALSSFFPWIVTLTFLLFSYMFDNVLLLLGAVRDIHMNKMILFKSLLKVT